MTDDEVLEVRLRELQAEYDQWRRRAVQRREEIARLRAEIEELRFEESVWWIRRGYYILPWRRRAG